MGTVANQTLKGLPVAATENGDPSYNGVLSYLPGQRLSRCTCPGESHPGPMHDDGTYVGRSAPEIDMFEAQVSDDILLDRLDELNVRLCDIGFQWCRLCVPVRTIRCKSFSASESHLVRNVSN